MNQLCTPEPHYTPGYSGYVPEYIYRCGDTYASITHKLLINPCSSHAENLVISNRLKGDYKLERPILTAIDVVKAHEKDRGDPIYRYPMVPGYDGFIPNYSNKCGKRFHIAATEGISEFEKFDQELKCKRRTLHHRTALQENNLFHQNLGEKHLTTTTYRYPLGELRPDIAGIKKTDKRELPEPPPGPYSKNTPPHFMEDGDEEKYIKSGYCGHVPFLFPIYGETHKKATQTGLGDFSKTYQFRRSIEWSPITGMTVTSAKPSGECHEIYLKNIGLIPNYAGHIPGGINMFGKTFGNGTVDAKRYLNERYNEEDPYTRS